jgi:cyclopropane fatty-acyl-phospholipid synthase-like methyltransferase
MDRYKETFETWNKVASHYQEKFMNLDLYNETYDIICNTLVKDKSRLLEVGCGPGNITKYLLNKKPDFNIFGIDVSPNMIELASKNNPSASFSVLDVRHISAINTKFDGIICGFCLPYLSPSDTEKFISDSYSLLNMDGLIYISFVEGEYSMSGFKTGSTGDRCYFYYHQLDKLKKQFVECKFEVLKIVKVEYKINDNEKEIHTILIANKKNGSA